MNLPIVMLAACAQFSTGVRNPVMWADVPDPSVCTDGRNYYMVSTTMHLMPGAPIMRSSDFVRWETVGYAFDRLEYNDNYTLSNGKTAYGWGQWASSLRYHNGRFYLWFTCNQSRSSIYTAERAEGPWTLLSRPDYRHDGSLFFDDDGRVYVFHGTGEISELRSDLTNFIPGRDHKLFERDAEETALLEGSSVFKENGWYYLMMVSCYIPGHIRREVCYRSRSLDNTNWEKKVILETEFEGYGGVGQGAVTKGPDGTYVAILFQDRGGIGRVPCVMGVRWKDGWPMLGLEKAKRGGAGAKRAAFEVGRIPNDTSVDYAPEGGVSGSDDFGSAQMKPYWQWNHYPVADKWSLSERPGYLRLRPAGTAASIFSARNTLTQRLFGPETTCTVTLDCSHLAEGGKAGLAAFQGTSGVLGVAMRGGRRHIVFTREDLSLNADRSIKSEQVTDEVTADLDGDVVELRVRAAFRHGEDYAEFAWRTPGGAWQTIGGRVALMFDHTKLFMGTRIALFSYSDREASDGYADFDNFTFVRGK